MSTPFPSEVELTCVDADATGYATFQSHNQKIVANRRGIFMTHIRARDPAYKAQTWRLSHSADGGRTFSVLYEATHATNAPVIETDAADNIYLYRVDLNTYADGFLYRFLADRDYRDPLISPVPQGSGDKYALLYDARRALLYCFVNHRKFHVLRPDGTVLHSLPHLFQRGRDASLEFPYLALEDHGTLHAAWTNHVNAKRYLYWDIHHMVSPDAGRTWRNLDGTPLEPPLADDQTGPTLRITADDEFEVHTMLASMAVQAGKLHFVYQAQTAPTARMHYLRYDTATGRLDQHRTPDWRGERIPLSNFDGFFVGRPEEPNAPLYCIMADGQRHIACLRSADNGATWHDHALSETAFPHYAISGCRRITDDGYLLGAFTERPNAADPMASAKVWFFRINAAL